MDGEDILKISRKITKDEILEEFRGIGDLLLTKAKNGDTKKLASFLNRSIQAHKVSLITQAQQKGIEKGWENYEFLHVILLLTHAANVVMLEYRNRVWKYDYMAFSRRIGELWEPFCKLCWALPVGRKITFFDPPTYGDVKDIITGGVVDFLNTTSLILSEKEEIFKYFDLIWELVASGDIQLKSDLHFESNGAHYNIDFKSGFGSNEKGNTNRLLMVGSIYKKLNSNYNNIILVRAVEEENNNYLQTLKKSGVWTVYCGDQTYKQIEDLTGFPLKKWIMQNITWENDIEPETMQYLCESNLAQYLKW
ncbi:hypothetical protein [Paenibacillus sp. WLX2291]|uniref:hypothetical protein n=1 Tax=Paenibacillus sp. WLX2291 TaxID=3296934 RepID=UPI003983F669